MLGCFETGARPKDESPSKMSRRKEEVLLKNFLSLL